MLKWLTNMQKNETYTVPGVGQTQEEAIAARREWLKDKIVGRPRAGTFTTEQLESAGYVGVYVEVPDATS